MLPRPCGHPFAVLRTTKSVSGSHLTRNNFVGLSPYAYLRAFAHTEAPHHASPTSKGSSLPVVPTASITIKPKTRKAWTLPDCLPTLKLKTPTSISRRTKKSKLGDPQTCMRPADSVFRQVGCCVPQILPKAWRRKRIQQVWVQRSVVGSRCSCETRTLDRKHLQTQPRA